MKFTHPSNRQKTMTSHIQRISKEVLLGKGEVPHITQFAIAHVGVGQRVEAHSHSDMYEVFFVVKGSGELNVNGEIFRISKDDTFVIEPNEPHSITNNEAEDMVLQYFGVIS